MNTETIKKLKERAKEMLEDNYDRKIGDEEIYTIICELENFYTAYEKEKETVDKINKLNIPVDTLLAEFERLEDLEDDLTTVYLNGVYDGEKKVEDKIKAKIEEVDIQLQKLKDGLTGRKTNFVNKNMLFAQKEVLQSLLEKE